MSKELCWYENYSLDLDIINPNKYNDHIARLNTKVDDKTMENKINKIEEDYKEKLKDIMTLCKNSNKIDELKSKQSLVILQKELDIIKLITKYTLQNKDLDYNFFIDCLNILLILSETLRVRLGQKEILHDKNNNPNNISERGSNSITRCSYKFCSYQDNCTYNYNLKTKNLCYQDHYVHNMVSADLKILLNYIKNKLNMNDIVILHNKEILKTINTLSFVIGHMESELRTKCLYLPENEWETCHVVKNK
jgi:hypothetical protein